MIESYVMKLGMNMFNVWIFYGEKKRRVILYSAIGHRTIRDILYSLR
jgi:hypothetical protein